MFTSLFISSNIISQGMWVWCGTVLKEQVLDLRTLTLLLEVQVKTGTGRTFAQLCLVSQFQHLEQEDLATVAHIFIATWLHFCNMFYMKSI